MVELNQAIKSSNNLTAAKSPPSAYYDLTLCPTSSESNHYSQYMSLEYSSSIYTAYMKIHAIHDYFYVRTLNLGKPNILSSKKVTVKGEFYSPTNDVWYSTIFNINCTINPAKF